MDLSALFVKARAFDTEFLIVRPGLSLALYSEVPLPALGPAVADVLEQYLAFVPPKSLETYYAANGTYKKLTPRVMTSTLKTLRAVPKGYSFFEFHFGQGPEGGVGLYAAHFVGTLLADPKRYPLETNLLTLEFPADQLERAPEADFIGFVARAAETFPYVSGNAGYAFQHPQTFSSEARKAIGALMPRYLGFDPSYPHCRDEMRGHSPSADWINLIGPTLVDQLGGAATVRAALPAAVEVRPAGAGLLIRGATRPPVGDVNRGAKDIEFLPDVARLLRPVRFEISGFQAAVDAAAWLARFDSLPSVPPSP
jgi:hypothetical protein